MARNVEIKARLEELAPYAARAERITGKPAEVIHQEDVFFPCATGRLKLRIFSPAEGELIFYRRPDRAGPKTSDYAITRTGEPALLRDMLERAYGVRAVVRKTRLLFRAGRTRIHLDSVEELGAFLELEVVLAEGEAVAAGGEEARALMAALEVEESSLIDVAYVDLLCEGVPHVQS